jgi:CubicO group peptidase (beta-lactamase class C family)
VHANPRRYDRDHLPWNEQAWHAAEVPSVNAIGTARAVARLYASLDRLLSPATLDLGRQPLSTYRDTLTGQPRSWGVGFQLQTDRLRLGPPRSAFGHTGAGGSAHGSWPEQKVGFSYAMNLLRDDEEGESRAGALLTALHDCMTARRDRPPQ